MTPKSMFMIQVHWMIARMSNHRWSGDILWQLPDRTQKSLVPHLWVHYSSWSWVCFSTFFSFPLYLCCDFFSNWELLFLRQQSTYTCLFVHCSFLQKLPSLTLKTYRLETDTLKWLSQLQLEEPWQERWLFKTQL